MCIYYYNGRYIWFNSITNMEAIVFILTVIFALTTGTLEYRYFSKISQDNTIHYLLTAIRIPFFAMLFVAFNPITAIWLLLCLSLIFPFFHDGTLYKLQGRGFFAQPSGDSNAIMNFTVLWRIIMLISGILGITFLILIKCVNT